jgi:hypothetical protein
VTYLLLRRGEYYHHLWERKGGRQRRWALTKLLFNKVDNLVYVA